MAKGQDVALSAKGAKGDMDGNDLYASHRIVCPYGYSPRLCTGL